MTSFPAGKEIIFSPSELRVMTRALIYELAIWRGSFSVRRKVLWSGLLFLLRPRTMSSQSPRKQLRSGFAGRYAPKNLEGKCVERSLLRPPASGRKSLQKKSPPALTEQTNRKIDSLLLTILEPHRPVPATPRQRIKLRRAAAAAAAAAHIVVTNSRASR